MTNDVAKKSDEVSCMECDWELIEALVGGTPAMRKSSTKYLPMFPNEDGLSYEFRRSTATLFPAYRRTVSVMASKPFSKQLTLSEDAPDLIREWAEDIDLQGVNLHTFAADMFAESFYGLAGILVESPKGSEESNKRSPTVAEQRAAGTRPYWVRVKHNQLLGWKKGPDAKGITALTQLRIMECDEVNEGRFGVKMVKQVRVLEPGKWETWREKEVRGRKEWRLYDKGSTGVDFIPFVPLYGLRKAFMSGEPTLRELAYLNCKHWQSQSDQDNILHVSRVPILFAKLMGNTAITVGASQAVKSDDMNADMKFVEHSGQAIGAGKESIEALEEQMIQSGAELLVAKPGQRTATEDDNDAEGNRCDLQRQAEGFEDALDLALYYTAKFASLDTGGKVSLFKDYAARTLSDASAQLVLSMQQSGLITKKTALTEMQRRGTLSPDIDPDAELKLADEEGPKPGNEDDDPDNSGNDQ